MTVSSFRPRRRNVVIGLLGASAGSLTGLQVVSPPEAKAQKELPPIAEMLEDRFLGSEDANVTVIEYASFTCPHCATFHLQHLEEFRTRYINTGKARLIFRDFPLDRIAMAASMLTRCVPENRYFPLVETIFRTQSSWARDENPVEALYRIARIAGVTPEFGKACINDRELFEGLLTSRNLAGRDLEINSTPTFIIGDERLVGVQSADDFAEFIE